MSYIFVSSILIWFPQCTHYFWRVFRFLFLERKQDSNVRSVKNVQGCLVVYISSAKKEAHFSQLFCLQVRSMTPWQLHDRKSRCLRGRRHSSILYNPSEFFSSYFINEVNFKVVIFKHSVILFRCSMIWLMARTMKF
jgi:hypothetical protein